MKNKLLCTFVALFIPLGLVRLAQAETPGVRDAANMFSADARKQANAELERIHKSSGWPIVFETVESLRGKSVDDLAIDKARSLQIRGVYVLLASKEHKISIQMNEPAAGVFDSRVSESLKQTITSAFKENKYDRGLLDGVTYLAKVAAEHPVGSAAAPLNRSADGRAAPADQAGRGSFLMTALVIGGVVLLVLFVIRLVAGAARSGTPGMSGMGSPGGGGFLSSLFGAMGGVMLGSWLYNTFSGGNDAHADSGHHGSDAGTSGSEYNDQYESTSGGWDGGGDAGGDAGGFDGGGDFGGGGGDW